MTEAPHNFNDNVKAQLSKLNLASLQQAFSPEPAPVAELNYAQTGKYQAEDLKQSIANFLKEVKTESKPESLDNEKSAALAQIEAAISQTNNPDAKERLEKLKSRIHGASSMTDILNVLSQANSVTAIEGEKAEATLTPEQHLLQQRDQQWQDWQKADKKADDAFNKLPFDDATKKKHNEEETSALDAWMAYNEAAKDPSKSQKDRDALFEKALEDSAILSKDDHAALEQMKKDHPELRSAIEDAEAKLAERDKALTKYNEADQKVQAADQKAQAVNQVAQTAIVAKIEVKKETDTLLADLLAAPDSSTTAVTNVSTSPTAGFSHADVAQAGPAPSFPTKPVVSTEPTRTV